MSRENLNRRIALLEAKDHCRDLCESMGYRATPEQLQDLMALSTDAERRQRIKEHHTRRPEVVRAVLEGDPGAMLPAARPATEPPRSHAEYLLSKLMEHSADICRREKFTPDQKQLRRLAEAKDDRERLALIGDFQRWEREGNRAGADFVETVNRMIEQSPSQHGLESGNVVRPSPYYRVPAGPRQTPTLG